MIEIYTEMLIDMIILIPYFKLPGFSEYSISSNIYDLWFILSSILVIYRLVRDRYRPSNLTKMIAILLIYLFFNTVIQGELTTQLIRHCFGTIILSLYIDYGLRKDLPSICDSLMNIFVCYTIANFACGYNTIFSTYLFGQRTNFTVISVPMIIISVLIWFINRQNGQKKNTLKTVIILGFNIMWIFNESVSTAILALLVFALMILSAKAVSFNKVPGFAYVLFLVIYNIVVVVMQSFDYMKTLFNALGESMTLTGRLEIWNNAMAAILSKPIFGYGFEMLSIDRHQYATATSYAHNEFIQQCVEGGVVQLVLFLIVLIIAIRYCSSNASSMLNRYFLAGFIGIGITMFTEIPSTLNYFYVFLLLMEYVTYSESCEGRFTSVEANYE